MMPEARQLGAKSREDGPRTVPGPLQPFVVPALLATIVLATFIAYSPVLFNFFNGDDFVHLSWLPNAISHPELIYRNFYSSWLDGTTTKFYRPLISVFMVSDYLLWGVNGLGFRLTNLAFHLASSLFVFLITRNLQSIADKSEARPESQAPALLWPAATAALFALYPLHPEAVSWITGRVDSVVTAFCLAAVFFYMKFSQSGRMLFFGAAAASEILGLLSKEMAITLPAVFVLYEIIYGYGFINQGTSKLKALIKPLARTLPFFFILLLYFAVRYMALGTFVGGYDDSLLFISNLNLFIQGWVQGICKLLVPINSSLIGSHHFLSKLYPAAVVLALMASLARLVLDLAGRKHLFFITGWLALSLLPVYKLFNIAFDLQGSRLAYLATVPLCMLMTAFAVPALRLAGKKIWQSCCLILSAVLIAIAGCVLYMNNEPWKEAGLETNAIRNSLQALYNNIDSDPQMIFLGLPDQINGAYTCRNALDGMTKKPQLSRSISNCLMINAFEPIFPFGFLKESILENQDKILIYKWNGKTKSFEKLAAKPDVSGSQPFYWRGRDLKKLAVLPEGQKSDPELSYSKSGNLVLKRSAAAQEYLELNIPERACFTCDIVEVELELSGFPAPDTGADLLYSNTMYPDFVLARRTRTQFTEGQKKQRLFFVLRGLPEWSLGGSTGPFRLLLPPATAAEIKSLAVIPWRLLLPQIKFDNSGYFGSKGYLHLGPQEKSRSIEINLGQIKGAEKFALEISRCNLLFESQNSQLKSRVSQEWKVFSGKERKVELIFEDFASPGIYELRVFPLAADDTVCGAASDHIVISVDPK